MRTLSASPYASLKPLTSTLGLGVRGLGFRARAPCLCLTHDSKGAARHLSVPEQDTSVVVLFVGQFSGVVVLSFVLGVSDFS